jgi:hypothetical protein
MKATGGLMSETTQLEAVLGRQMVTLNVKGAAPAGEMHEVAITLYDVPRVGDQISVWTGREEAYIKVGEVTWPAWAYGHDSDRDPEIWLVRPEDITDEEWAEIFAAIREERHP